MTKQLEIEQVLGDPAASFWLKDALRSALDRDPVDAANDAEVSGPTAGSKMPRDTEAGLNQSLQTPSVVSRPQHFLPFISLPGGQP